MSAEVQAMIEALARDLRRSVAIDDLDFRLVAFTSHEGNVDPVRREAILSRQGPAEARRWARKHGVARARGPLRLPANPELEMLPRVCVPLRAHDRHLGYLWLIDPEESLDDTALRAAEATAAQCAEALLRERMRDELADARERELLRDLLADDEPVRAMAAEEVVTAGVFDAAGPFTVMHVGVAEHTEVVDHDRIAAAQADALAGLPRRLCLRLVRPTHGIVVASAEALQLRPALAESLATVRAGGSAQDTLVVGVGEPVDRLDSLPRCDRQAANAMRLAQVLPWFRPVARWSDLGVYALLSELSVERLTTSALHPAVTEMQREDASLAETLERYLDRAGDTRAVARELHVHRATVYYRLNRIQELTGVDLSNGEHRLALHLSLKLLRLVTGPVASPGTPVDATAFGRSAAVVRPLSIPGQSAHY